jgi:hypothetical protein
VTQALNGASASDPIREREYKRARRQITDGIQGTAIGGALLTGAVVAYLLLPREGVYYAVSLGLALAGLIKLFRSVGHIVDAKIGARLIEKGGQATRSSGGLSPQPSVGAPTTRVSQRLPAEVSKEGVTPKELPQPDKAELPSSRQTGVRESPARQGPVPQQASPQSQPSPIGATRVGTSRVGRDQSSPLRKPEKEQDVLSRLRN